MRDIQRNYALAAWAIRKHLDFVSSFTFDSRNNDEGLDTRIEELMEWWMRSENCEVTGRHPFRRCMRLAEARRTVDGDVFWMKLDDGRVQAVEGDRVRNPLDLPPGLVKSAERMTHGVKTDAAGRPLAYCVCKRTGQTGFTVRAHGRGQPRAAPRLLGPL